MRPFYLFPILIVWLCCCSTDKEKTIAVEEEIVMQEVGSVSAEVSDVSVSGEENEYSFSVTIKSPDTGCDQYADWWEVFDTNGGLIYRRILAHSHVNEQPFTRSGGPVEISKDSEVYIRVHMNNSGYSNKVFKGSVENGFVPEDLDIGFAKELEEVSPLPEGCDF